MSRELPFPGAMRSVFSTWRRAFGLDSPRVTMDDVLAATPTAVDASVAWGPITREVTSLAGALVPTSSVLLVPDIPQTVKDAVLALIPAGAWALPSDTPASLASRLSSLGFFEEAHVLKAGGAGKRRLRLLETTYSQPRRKSWSVEVRPPSRQPDGNWAADYT